jgi:D-beta-D-heptose 7-phosphate kinase / D-beta-D-heptose 1-phosphate adenosyltransferase
MNSIAMQETVFIPKSSAKVLVVGDIILDQYIYGETNRISPEAPVPVLRVDNTEERAGGAANVAINISSLGIPVQLLGITGKDDSSERLKNILNDKKVECHFIKQDNFSTITKQRVLSRHQQLIRLDYEKESGELDTSDLIEQYMMLLETVDVVILSDYAKGSLDKVQTLIKFANEKNVKVLVDPKSKDFSIYSSATVVTPNLKEFEAVVGECKSDKSLIEKGSLLCKELNLAALLVTRGEKGMTLIRNDVEPFHLKAETHEVYDVTGAGDTVIAVLAAAIACDFDLEQATEFANTAAGLVVEKLGAATVTVDELNGENSNKHQSPVLTDHQAALQVINQAKRNGEQIVMTNGCFDILHMGHVDYLSKAKSLGDRLIVAVNDDDSVKQLKGESRPINTINNRMAILAALACVDWVVSFNEETPEELISMLKPDILVKGGDYTEDQIAGAKVVRKTGGNVVILPFKEGCSTTSMLDKIKETHRG